MATQTSTQTETAAKPLTYALEHSTPKKPLDVEVDIHYFKEAEDGRLVQRAELASLEPIFLDTRRMLVRDVRGNETNFKLEINGFQYFIHPASERSILEEDKIKEQYYPELEDAVKKLTGAKIAKIYNHVIRDGPWAVGPEVGGVAEARKTPSTRPHIDLARSWAPKVIEKTYEKGGKAEADSILSSHWQLINAWIPLKTVQKNPLAVIDSTTIPASDHSLVHLTHDTPNGTYTTDNLFTMATHADQHQWYYMSEQEPDEVLLLKIFDSDDDAKAPGTDHGSFNDPKTEHLPTRESIELRFILSY